MRPSIVLAWFGLFLVALAACGEAPAPAPASCSEGETLCAGQCVDLNTNRENCGSCDRNCGSSEVCDGSGQCALSCQDGLSDCDGTCSNLDSDNQNCGSCGRTCLEGEICDGNGQCALSCQDGLSDCDGNCSNLASDNQNCGSCGKACAAGDVCYGNGQCALSCQSGLTDCSGTCSNLASDNKNCGSCGKACAAGDVCNGNGQCALSCQSGLTDCSGTCSNLASDNKNCGSCGKACASGEACNGNGQCALSCQSGLTDCSGTCTDLSNSPAHCGSCSNSCATGEACLGGNCLPLASKLVDVAVGYRHSCVRTSANLLKCWGSKTYTPHGLGVNVNWGDDPGEVNGNFPYVELGTGRTIKGIYPGSFANCAILDNDALKCWGSNLYGGLGIGNSSHRGGSPSDMGDNLPAVNLGTGVHAVYAALGGFHSCAILNNGKVKCWGRNNYGQLGYGDTTTRGTNSQHMGDNLPYVDLGTGRTAVKLALGYEHSCAILDNQRLKCWGRNSDGQLGLGNTSHRGDQAGEMGNSLPYLKLGSLSSQVREVSSFRTHTCAISNSNQLKCWGRNTRGQLGYGNDLTIGDQASEMDYSLNWVYLGSGRTVLSVSTGYEHTCAILDNNSVKCWGYATLGCLGYEDFQVRGDDSGEMGNNLPTVNLGTGRSAKKIYSGAYHNCALLDNDEVKCWGYNNQGQLGIGNTETMGNNSGEMGDNLPALQL